MGQMGDKTMEIIPCKEERREEWPRHSLKFDLDSDMFIYLFLIQIHRVEIPKLGAKKEWVPSRTTTATTT